MASGRVLSPDFWTDAAMIELPIPVRLFYIGTWTFACSAGHIKDDPMQIRLQVLPADPIDGAAFIEQLVTDPVLNTVVRLVKCSPKR